MTGAVVQPTISVLLAVYNGAKYLPELLDSLLTQHCVPHEIVVCDDGSTDDSLRLLQGYAERSSVPIHIHSNAKNLGYRDNFWFGMSLCQGDYIAFCDQDDVWFSEKLDVMHKAILEHDYPSFLFSDCALVDAKLSPLNALGLEYSGVTKERKALVQTGRLAQVLVERPCVTGMTMVARRDILLSLPLPILDIPHDYLISTALSAVSTYVFLDQPLVFYRQHLANVIGMNAQRRGRKRWPVTDWNIEGLSKDLLAGLGLCNYVLSCTERFHTTSEFVEMYQEAKVFFEYRLSRRQSFAQLLKPIRIPAALACRLRSAHRLWLKDLRVYLRLKVGRFVRLFLQ